MASVAIATALLLVEARADTYGDLQYQTNSSGVSITGYTGRGGDVTIPRTINGLPVTSIGGGAFSGCTSLTSITILSGLGIWSQCEG